MRELPESLPLQRLKELNLANNYFQSIPDDFLSDVKKLESLNLSSNEIGKFMESEYNLQTQ